MSRSKKIMFISLFVVLVLGGSIAGVAFAQTGDGNTGSGKTLLARVAEILGIDQQKLEDAFAQAQREVQEEALNNRLQDLVDQGTITQEQADQYKQWWQSRPEITIPGPFGHCGRGWGGKLYPLCPPGGGLGLPQSPPE